MGAHLEWRVPLGACSAVALSQARAAAAAIMGDVAKGRNPAAERKELAAAERAKRARNSTHTAGLDRGLAAYSPLWSAGELRSGIAQGLENGSREDLSFIERAIFAMRIEDAGHKRSVVQHALSIDRAEASKLIAVAKAIPHDIVEAIGKAPKIGRGRWQAFADLLTDAEALNRTRDAITVSAFATRDTDKRFLIAFSAASRRAEKQVSKAVRLLPVIASGGQRIGQIQQADRELKLTIDKNVPASFAEFLVEQLPHLFDAFSASDERKEPAEAQRPHSSTTN